MATLEINGRRVEVADSFRALTPEQQQATVEEIAASMGPTGADAMRARGLQSPDPTAANSIASPDNIGGVPEGMTLDPISGQMRDREMRGRANPVTVPQGMMRSAQHGMGFGTSDEVNAALGAADDYMSGRAGLGEAYTSRLEDERAILDKFRTDHPVAAYGSEIAGAMVLPAGALRGGSLAAKAVHSAAIGGGQGAAYGFGAGEGDAASRSRSAAVHGGIGAVAGAAVPYAVAGVGKALDKRAVSRAVTVAAKAAPDDLAMRAESKALFDSAKARGVQVKATAYAPLAGNVLDLARDFGADEAITPGALAAAKRLTGTSGHVDWQDIEIARRVASNSARAAKQGSPDAALSGQVVEKIDEFVFNLVDGDLTAGTAGNAGELGEELKQARAIWSRIKNSERITDAIDAASVAKSGTENGIRNEFIRLRKDKKFFRSLSKLEQDAIVEVVRGTPTGFLLRLAGKFSFGHGQQSGLIGGTIGSGTAYALGSSFAGWPGGMAAVAGQQALSRGAQELSDAAATKAAERAGGIVRAGGLQSLPAPTNTMFLENALRRGARIPAVGTNALSPRR